MVCFASCHRCARSECVDLACPGAERCFESHGEAAGKYLSEYFGRSDRN